MEINIFYFSLLNCIETFDIVFTRQVKNSVINLVYNNIYRNTSVYIMDSGSRLNDLNKIVMLPVIHDIS